MRILLLCAATFAGGLLVGALVWPETQGRRRRAAAPSEPPSSSRSEPAAGISAGPIGAITAEEPIEELRGLVAEAAAEHERVVTSAPAESVLAGQGTVTGTVRDPAGNPVAGVIVSALPQARPFALALSAGRTRERQHEDRALSDVARDAIQSELWRRHARRTAISGADGRYELRGLMDGRNTVTAFHDEFDVRPLSQQGRVVPDAVVDFLAQPVVEAQVEVRMPDGALAEHAWLNWEGPHGQGWGAWTAEPGTARLPPGPCKIKAQTSVPEPLQSEMAEYRVDPADSEHTIVLQLKGRPVLTARLVLPEGYVLPRNVEYRLRLLGDDTVQVDPTSLLKDSSPRRPTAPSPGRAHWLDLEPGRYLVAAFLDRRRLMAHATVEVGEGATEVELEVNEPSSEEYLVVRLLGPDGGPTPGHAGFHITSGQVIGARYQKADAVQRDDGAWMVLLSGIDPGGADRLTLRVATRDYGSALVPFDVRRRGTLTVRLGQPAKLRVELRGYSGSGLEGKLYVALRTDDGIANYGQFGAEGGCELSGVQPRDYDLQLAVRGSKAIWSILRRSIRLGEGEEELSLTLPALHTLRVRVAGDARPRSVTLTCEDPSVGSFRRTAQINRRIASFPGLAAGSYEIAWGAKRASVRVSGATEVTLQ